MLKRQWPHCTPVIVLVGMVLAYGLGFGCLAARAYPAHESAGAYDLGNHVQSLWHAARGHGLTLTLVPEFGDTRFSMHVEPTLFLLAPFVRFLTDDPRLLLWFQAIVMGLAGWPLFLLARRRLGTEWGAVCVVAALFLLPSFESATLFEFHSVSLTPTLLLAAMFFVDRALLANGDKRGIWADLGQRIPFPDPFAESAGWASDGRAVATFGVLAGVLFLLALGTKEDVSLLVLALGFYFFFSHRRSLGVGLSAVGLAWFVVATYVVIPANRLDGTHSAYLGFFSELGQTPAEILVSPLRHPEKVLGLVFSAGVLRGLAMLLVPLAFTPVPGWRFFVLAAPSLAIPLLSSNPMMNQLETYHYGAPAVAFLMLATVDGLTRLVPIVNRTYRVVSQGRATIGGSDPYPVRSAPTFFALVVLLVSIVYHVFRGYSPLAMAFHWPAVTPHDRTGDRLAASIPADAPVLAQAELVPLVARRPWVRIWHGPFDTEAEYVFLDVSHPKFLNRDGAQERLLADMAFDPSFGLMASEDGYLLLKRGAERVATTPEFFSFVFADPPASAVPVDAAFGEQLRMIAYETSRQTNDREGEPLVTLYWDVLRQPATDYLIALFLLDDQAVPVGATLHQQPVTVWWPTSRWNAGDRVRVLANTFPWWTGDRADFGYGVAVVIGQDAWDTASRLPVVRQDGGAKPIDGNTVLPLVEFRRVAGIPYARR